jgi:acyl-CoA dehydrogenase
LIDFQLTEAQHNIKQFLHWFAENKMRPISLQADKEGDVPRGFLMEVMNVGISAGNPLLGEAEAGGDCKRRRRNISKSKNIHNRIGGARLG